MGKITEVLYQEIDSNRCSTYRAGEYYFYANMIGANPKLDSEYIGYEEEQLKLRNTVIGEYIENTGEHPNVEKSIFGISTIKNKAVIITEYK